MTRDTHPYCRAFDRVGVTNCFNDSGISWLGFPFLKLSFYNLCFDFEKANTIVFIFQFTKVTRNPDVIRSLPHVNVYCPYDENFEFIAFAFRNPAYSYI